MKVGPKSSLRPFLHRALQFVSGAPGVAPLKGTVLYVDVGILL